MSTVLLEIVTPERIVYSESVSMVSVRGAEGELGILPNHIPLVTPLRVAPVRIKKDGKEEAFIAVGGGFLEVRKDKITILAETAELPEEIDVDRARAAKERAEKRLQSRMEEIDFRRAEIALQKALTRLDVSEHR